MTTESQLLDLGGGLVAGKPNRQGIRTISVSDGGRTVGYVANRTDEELLGGKVESVERLKIVDPAEQKIEAVRAKAKAARTPEPDASPETPEPEGKAD